MEYFDILPNVWLNSTLKFLIKKLNFLKLNPLGLEVEDVANKDWKCILN